MSDRLIALQRMLERNPRDGRAHFGLAAEYEKQGDWARVVHHLEHYLELADDQGNAWGRLGKALAQLGRPDAAISAYQRGIAQAQQYGHPSMAAEFEETIQTLQPD